MFIVKLMQGAHCALYLVADYPTVTWAAERKLAITFETRATAISVADKLRSYGTVGIEPRD